VSKHRTPHGQYVRQTGDWFMSRRMAGGAGSAAVAAKYSQASLYNDASDGSILHVIGLSLTTATTQSNIGCYIIQGFMGAPLTSQPVPIGPFFKQLPGKFYFGSDAALVPALPIWVAGGLQAPAEWPHDFPVCFLNPGYSLVCQANVVNSDSRAVFHWLAMGTNEGFY
jgi:hypothetical protein